MKWVLKVHDNRLNHAKVQKKGINTMLSEVGYIMFQKIINFYFIFIFLRLSLPKKRWAF